ncbi:HbrB-like-domain-containing protein [Halenospora varia]|nr:HbrB-like-domain-containing protein [Halenospora varia]
MSQSTGPSRAPGSFSPVVPPSSQSQSTSSRPQVRRVESSSSEDSGPLTINKARIQQQNAPAPPRPPFATSHANSSSSSLQNFSRPTPPAPSRSDLPLRNATPLTSSSRPSGEFLRGHGRKHSQTQGSFEPFLPTAASSNLSSMANLNSGMSASTIAAQAAMQHQTHNRQRSQTVPTQHADASSTNSGNRRPSRGPTSPPLLSLTEASGPRESGFGGQVYHNGLLAGGNQSAAQTAANVVFPKSPASSPGLPPSDYEHQRMLPDKPIKTEKSKVKLFSRPGKIGISKDKEARAGALPSPSKLAFTLQRGNFSTNSLADTMSSAASMYSMANSSSATIRAVDTPPTEKEKDKEKHKHHFLSRQKHKLSSKDDHHLPLSSAASNSRPVDPTAPSSLYNFNLPPSPGPTTTSFAKSMSGLDLRHGGRALREKKKEEKSDALRESEVSYQNNNEWPGPSSLGSGGGSYMGSAGGSYANSVYGIEPPEYGKYGLNNMGPDDAWPFLKAKLLIIFEGEDLRLPVEDFNRLVTIHLQRCVQKRAPNLIVEDLRDLLSTGFSSLDQTLRRTPDERLIPHLVEMWLFTFTSILPYMQAVFLPLDLEFSGHGPLMSAEQARDFWGAVPSSNGNISASQALEVRRIVLIAYRDTVILPRFDTLKTIFSRLSLESISLSIPSQDILSTSPDSFGRPSTAMSLDPSHGSYGSQATTLLGGGSSGDGSGMRSRAISNVSHGSEPSSIHTSSGHGINNPPPPQRPFTPSSTHPFHPLNRGQREKTVEDSSKQLTETVGRMLQCMSVLASVGVGGGGEESCQRKMEELTRGLKLNWLGRGRMGRDRRGLVGARVVQGTMGGGIMAQ